MFLNSLMCQKDKTTVFKNKKMSNKTLNYALTVYILFCIIVIAGFLYGSFTFGHGLGDVIMLFYLALSVVIVIILKSIRNLFRWDVLFSNSILFLIIVFLLIYFILCLTTFRGPENPW
jgi:hypothetical protein